MLGSVLGRRKLWTMTCETLFQILAASLTPEEITKLCHKHRVPLPAAGRGTMALYQLAHEQCHRKTPFSRQVQQCLNHQHAGLLRRFDATPVTVLRQTVETILTLDNPALADDIAGMLWAVASDPRQEIRQVEQALVQELHLLSHALLLAQLRRQVQVVAQQHAPPQSQEGALRQEVAQLQDACQHLTASVACLRQQEAHYRQENAHLQARLTECAVTSLGLHQQLAAVRSQETQAGAAARELKKLRYQVARLTASVTARETEIKRLQTLLASDEVALSQQENDVAAHESLPLPPPVSHLGTLQGKTVALIGGREGAAAHYEHLVQELGGDCLLYSGNRGAKKLAEVIRQADIVFCPVDYNSHGAAASTKKLCRAMRKSCYFLRSSGVSHIREKLLEIVSKEQR